MTFRTQIIFFKLASNKQNHFNKMRQFFKEIYNASKQYKMQGTNGWFTACKTQFMIQNLQKNTFKLLMNLLMKSLKKNIKNLKRHKMKWLNKSLIFFKFIFQFYGLFKIFFTYSIQLITLLLINRTNEFFFI